MASQDYTIPNPFEPSKPLACVNLSGVVKLTSSNYINWQLQVEAILDGHNLFQFLDGSNPAPAETISSTTNPPVVSTNPAYQTWRKQDRLIYGAILTTLSDVVASLVSQTRTSGDLWALLKKTYVTASLGHVNQLKARLRNATKGAQSIIEYMHSVKVTADLLASIGKPVAEEDLTDYILRGLDDSYKPVADGVNARDSSISFDELLEKLIHQELALSNAQKHTPGPTQALTAQSKPHKTKSPFGQRPWQSPNPQSPQPNNQQQWYASGASSNQQRPPPPKPYLGKCQWCNVQGHVMAHCGAFRQQYPHIPPPAFHRSSGPSQQFQANTVQSGASASNFILDSGATHHVTKDLDNLALYHPYTGRDGLYMGDGSGPLDRKDTP